MLEKNINYELIVIIDSGIGQLAVDKRLESIRKRIKKHGEIFFEDIWGERDLAYTMKGNDKGYYAVFDFSFEPDQLKEFETSLRLEPEVIRHLTVRLPLKYEPKTMEDLVSAHQVAKNNDEETIAENNSGDEQKTEK